MIEGMTYAEAIEALRQRREQISAKIERLRAERNRVNADLLNLEQAVTPPKVGRVKPGDVVMIAEPANVSMVAPKKG